MMSLVARRMALPRNGCSRGPNFRESGEGPSHSEMALKRPRPVAPGRGQPEGALTSFELNAT